MPLNPSLPWRRRKEGRSIVPSGSLQSEGTRSTLLGNLEYSATGAESRSSSTRAPDPSRSAYAPTASAPGLGSPPAEICTRETGPTPATSALGLGSPLPHLHRDCTQREQSPVQMRDATGHVRRLHSTCEGACSGAHPAGSGPRMPAACRADCYAGQSVSCGARRSAGFTARSLAWPVSPLALARRLFHAALAGDVVTGRGRRRGERAAERG